MDKHKVFLIIGRTASGKTSMCKEMETRLGLHTLMSYTDRPMRETEKKGRCDHTFVTKEEADMLLKDTSKVIAYTTSIEDGYRRFATIDQLQNADLYIIDPNGVDTLKLCKNPVLGNMEFVEIYVRVPYQKAKENAKRRKHTESDFTTRYEQESKQFAEYEKRQAFRYHILNDTTLEDACDKLERIIRKELEL